MIFYLKWKCCFRADFIRRNVIENRTGWPIQKLCSLFYGAVPNIGFYLAFSEVLQVDGEWQGKKKEELLPVCKAVTWSCCKVTCLKIDLPILILCKWRKFDLCHLIVRIEVGRALLKGKIAWSLTCLFTICCKFNIISNMSHYITTSVNGSMSRMRSNLYYIYCQIEITVFWTHILQKL